MTTAPSPPAVLRFTRASAVLITTAIGVASFILSFAALRDLANPRRLAAAPGVAVARYRGRSHPDGQATVPPSAQVLASGALAIDPALIAPVATRWFRPRWRSRVGL